MLSGPESGPGLESEATGTGEEAPPHPEQSEADLTSLQGTTAPEVTTTLSQPSSEPARSGAPPLPSTSVSSLSNSPSSPSPDTQTSSSNTPPKTVPAVADRPTPNPETHSQDDAQETTSGASQPPASTSQSFQVTTDTSLAAQAGTSGPPSNPSEGQLEPTPSAPHPQPGAQTTLSTYTGQAGSGQPGNDLPGSGQADSSQSGSDQTGSDHATGATDPRDPAYKSTGMSSPQIANLLAKENTATIEPLTSPTPALSTQQSPAQSVALLRAGVGMQDAIENIHATIEIAARQGLTQARIALQPEELGSIRIHLSQSSEGLIARVTADTPDAAAALAAGHAELRESLSSIGLPLLRLDIGSFSQSNPQAREQNTGSAENSSTTTGSAGESEPEDQQTIGELGGPARRSGLTSGALVDVLA